MGSNLTEWPTVLWLVRHGESAGNLARDKAHAAGISRIDIAERDVDVPLSPRGLEQSRALGAWFAGLGPQQQPEVVLVSPYRRAMATGEIIQELCAASDERQVIVDERLREKEFGILDRLTRQGIQEFFPEQAEIRKHVGKFYHRPPGGESWCDVILRLRSALHTLSLYYAGKRVLVVTHQVVVLCFRYLLENLTESELLEIDAQGDVANCSVTEYLYSGIPAAAHALALRQYNWIAPLREAGASVTSEPDPSSANR
ncbi:MAG TPA: histidine phosphatase family protein [Steroidobacteraceae bacterium]|nr:histidine phosphatase family protein [Steroidobacteraceae bacterium]